MNSETADVIVVGGGIVGLSIAYQLSRRQAGRVIVLEKGSAVGQGSTGASSACLRLRYSNTEVIQLALDGLNTYRDWQTFTRLDKPRAAAKRTGVLWTLGEDEATVISERDRMLSLGASALALSVDELAERFPAISPCSHPLDLTGETEHECDTQSLFLYEEDGGYCTDPVGANQDLLEACLRDGVDVRFKTAVVDVHTSGGRVIGATLNDGSRIDAPQLVNAAGPWCNNLNALAGLEHKWTLQPLRIQVILRATIEPVPGGLPMVGDTLSGIYFRPESNGQQILVGSVRPEDEEETVADPDKLDNQLDEELKARMLYGLHHRVPGLEHRGRVTGVAGLYTMNEQDVHPVVGATHIDGFYVANGFSGHGFKLAPAVGSLMAQILTDTTIDGDTTVSPDFLSIERDSLAVREKNVLA
ncbi:MAG: NAD(P)/FAD-dependent oxidoreductase [Acidimicrobiales bacterium]